MVEVIIVYICEHKFVLKDNYFCHQTFEYKWQKAVYIDPTAMFGTI